jgi:regulator of sirC expression with transglutaminase-like and TPR domain
VYLELAKRIGFPMAGVGMPGHFLIRPTGEDMAIFVDPFHQGEVLFEQDCRDRFQHLFGDWGPFMERTTWSQFPPPPFWCAYWQI